MRVRYKTPFLTRLLLWTWPVLKVPAKVLVLLYAIRGKYPWWMVTPDDPVSPFGSGTTPTASNEPTVRKVYEKFGRYIGDVYWLAWRNSFYGLRLSFKPAWLADPATDYWKLNYADERVATEACDTEGNPIKVGTIWLQQPDGTWLTETTRKFGPLYTITGYRLKAVAEGGDRDRAAVARGEQPIGWPFWHPNADGRAVFSIRTSRTM